MSKWLIVSVLFLGLVSHPNHSVAKNTKLARKVGVVKLFRKATIKYKKNEFVEAAEIYTKILRAFPDHEPSKIQLAKSLYR